MSSFAFVNTYAYSVTYLTDKMLRGLQELIRELGLDPKRFADDWSSSSLAVRPGWRAATSRSSRSRSSALKIR